MGGIGKDRAPRGETTRLREARKGTRSRFVCNAVRPHSTVAWVRLRGNLHPLVTPVPLKRQPGLGHRRPASMNQACRNRWPVSRRWVKTVEDETATVRIECKQRWQRCRKGQPTRVCGEMQQVRRKIRDDMVSAASDTRIKESLRTGCAKSSVFCGEPGTIQSNRPIKPRRRLCVRYTAVAKTERRP